MITRKVYKKNCFLERLYKNAVVNYQFLSRKKGYHSHKNQCENGI